MWERGAKLQYTEPSPVNAAEHAVYWGNTLLKQVSCFYMLAVTIIDRGAKCMVDQGFDISAFILDEQEDFLL